MTTSILLVGVGGQGTILMSKILTQGLMEKGYDVKMSEIHGMSQRGGSVTTQIRYGEQVSSPSIGPGEADILVSFEKLEALRYLGFLKKDGLLLMNDQRIAPLPVLIGAEQYPENISRLLEERMKNLIIVGAEKLAEEAGNIKSVNIVMLGAFVRIMKLEAIDWKALIAQNVMEKFVEVNKIAYDLGYEIASEILNK